MRPRLLLADDPVDPTDTRRREMTAVAQPASRDEQQPTGRMTMRTVQGGGGLRLHIREWGKTDGPPILFIHGWSQSHLCWAKQYQSTLADEFRLVAYDLRGHGMSQAPLEPEHYTDPKLWADDVAAIIAQLGLDRPVLVGWSYGSFIICDYLRTHGQDHIAAIDFVAGAVKLGQAAFGTLIGPASSTISPTRPRTTCRPTSAACAPWSKPSRPSRSRPTTSRRCCARA
jgi:non-heme chloroperoxidase